jgi:hypothetical protein
MDSKEFFRLQEAYLGLYIQEEVDLWVNEIIEEGYDIDEYTDEELLEAFLNERKNEDPKGVANKAGVNKPDSWGPPTKFGQEATRNSLARGMRGVRTLQRAGVRINRHHRNKYLAHKVHQGWSKAAKESKHQTPEQKQRRSKLIKPDLATFRRDLPKSERDKDVPFVKKAERAVNKKGEFASDNEPQLTARQQRLKKLQAAQRERNQAKGVSEDYDLYDIVMDYLLDEGYAETPEAAESIMVNMSEDWREGIVEKLDQLDEISRGLATRAKRERESRYKKAVNKSVNSGSMYGSDWRTQEKKVHNLNRSLERRGIKPISTAESYDLYDIILSHLLDEGYAETPEAAEVIMVNMSEEWRESIVEEIVNEAWKPANQQKINRQIERAKKKEDVATYQRKDKEANRQWDRQRAMRFGKKMSELGSR